MDFLRNHQVWLKDKPVFGFVSEENVPSFGFRGPLRYLKQDFLQEEV
jgi:hypothetical protein